MSTPLTPGFFLKNAPPRAASRWVVGFSGGLDSTALLALCAAWRDQAGPGLELVAVHVHHGLSDQADNWLRHCERVCQQLNVAFISQCIEIVPTPQRSTEQLAREGRYGVFRQMCRAEDLLLLAHHQDDQVETLLYRLMRGSGALGLGAMASFNESAGLAIWRPLLQVSRADLDSWVRQRGLPWVEDPSNQDTRYDRNFIRNEIVPALAKRWPAVRSTLSRSARLAAESAALNEVLAAMDISPAETAADGGSLVVSQLQCLEALRLKNVLRYWLRQQGASLPSERVLAQAVTAVRDYHEEQNTLIDWQQAGSSRRWQLRTFQGHLWLLPEQPVPDPEWHGTLSPGTALALPAGMGQLLWVAPDDAPNAPELQQTNGAVTLAADPANQSLTVRFRRGGERFQPAGRPTKSLKKWLHEWRVPPWQRERLPLVFRGDQLIWVPGYGVAAGCEAPPGSPDTVTVVWHSPGPVLQD